MRAPAWPAGRSQRQKKAAEARAGNSRGPGEDRQGTKHFATAMRDLQARLESAQSEEERSALTEKLAEVEAGRA